MMKKMKVKMRIRRFIAAIATFFSLWPLTAPAQQPLMPSIGILGSTSSQVQANFLRAFQQGLGEAGYVEGRDAAVEYRWADDQNEKLPALAADLVRRRVNVIVAAASTPAATIPPRNSAALRPARVPVAKQPCSK